MELLDRRGFIAGAASFAAVPLLGAKREGRALSRPLKTPLMLDVKRMAVHDGPGLRTTFFVKGCPLRCIWCHNPESIDPKPQEARFQHLCRHCAHCTHDEATCPTRAFKLYGRPWTQDALVAKALEDRAFYDASGGGVTLSGGEPLFFWEWAAELRRTAREMYGRLQRGRQAQPGAPRRGEGEAGGAVPCRAGLHGRRGPRRAPSRPRRARHSRQPGRRPRILRLCAVEVSCARHEGHDAAQTALRRCAAVLQILRFGLPFALIFCMIIRTHGETGFSPSI